MLLLRDWKYNLLLYDIFRYTSDEFTSIFTEKKQPFSSQSYSEVVIEEQTFEETVVTDNIEYVVDEAQNQTEYQTQEVCGSMEGEVILEDGRQLKVDSMKSFCSFYLKFFFFS